MDYCYTSRLSSNNSSVEICNEELDEHDFTNLINELAQNDNLTALSLQFINLTDERIRILFEVLKTNTSKLKHLDLRSNFIGAGGAKIISQYLMMNPSLTALNLGNNNIGEEGTVDITNSLLKNEQLNTICLTGNNIGSSGAQAIAELFIINNTINNVDLSYNNFTNIGMDIITRSLTTNKSLIYLNLAKNISTYGELALLCEVLKLNLSMATLILCNNSISDAGALSISNLLLTNCTLTSINLSDNLISDIGAIHIAECLKKNNLIELDLEINQVGDQGLKVLSKALRYNNSLDLLNLSFNNISNTGVNHLSKAMKTNQKLSQLLLMSNNITDAKKWITNLLKHNNSLQYLDISCNSIRNKGLEYFSNALGINESVTELNFSQNSIGDDGAKFITLALSKNIALLSLDISENDMSEVGMNVIIQGLKNQPSRLIELAICQRGIKLDDDEILNGILATNQDRSMQCVEQLIIAQIILCSSDRGILNILPPELIHIIIFQLGAPFHLLSILQTRLVCKHATQRFRLSRGWWEQRATQQNEMDFYRLVYRTKNCT